MTQSHTFTPDQLQDEFGDRIAARLSAGARALPHDVSERLKMARSQALARRRTADRVANVRARTVSAVFGNGGSSASLGGGSGPGLWTRWASVVPLLALAAGLVAIQFVQDDNRVSELADVDAALLTDDLPPSAYTDPGFVQFLKDGGPQTH